MKTWNSSFTTASYLSSLFKHCTCKESVFSFTFKGIDLNNRGIIWNLKRIVSLDKQKLFIMVNSNGYVYVLLNFFQSIFRITSSVHDKSLNHFIFVRFRFFVDVLLSMCNIFYKYISSKHSKISKNSKFICWFNKFLSENCASYQGKSQVTFFKSEFLIFYSSKLIVQFIGFRAS